MAPNETTFTEMVSEFVHNWTGIDAQAQTEEQRTQRQVYEMMGGDVAYAERLQEQERERRQYEMRLEQQEEMARRYFRELADDYVREPKKKKTLNKKAPVKTVKPRPFNQMLLENMTFDVKGGV